MTGATGITAVVCPRCGGTPDPEGGPGLLARCGSCGVLGRIEDAAGGPALAVLPAVTPGALEAIIEAECARRGAPRLVVLSSELMFVPYWRVECVLAARVQGERPRRVRVIQPDLPDNEGQGVSLRSTRFAETWIEDAPEEIDRDVQRIQTVLVSGCPLEELGLPTLDRRQQMPGRLGVGRRGTAEVVVFHPGLRETGTVLDPLVDSAAAQAEADVVLDAARGGLAHDLLPGATVDAAVLARELSLVFYPVFLAQVDAGGHGGTVCVDGVSGEVAAVRVPDDAAAAAAIEKVAAVTAALSAGWIPATMLRSSVWPSPALESLQLADPGRLGALGRGLGIAFAAGILVALARWLRRSA